MTTNTMRNVPALIESGAIRAAIFDVYGTLVDWVPHIRQFLVGFARDHFSDDALRRLGTNRSGLDAAINGTVLLQVYDGVRRRVQIEHPTALYPEVLRRSLDGFAKASCVEPVPAESHRFAEGPRNWPAFPDSHALLSRLRETGFVVTAVSNIDNVSLRYTCDRALDFQFDEVVTAEDIGAYKPDPRLLEAMVAILEERGIRAEETVLIAQSLYADHKPAADLCPSILRVHVNRPASVLGLMVGRAPALDWEVSSLAEFNAIVFGGAKSP